MGEEIKHLFIKYQHDIYNYLVYFTGKRDVEDLVQEVFVKLIKSKYSQESISHPKALLFTMARNVAIDHIRKVKLLSLVPFNFDHHPQISEGLTPLRIVESKEDFDRVVELLNQLNNKQKNVVILRKIQGYSTEETADILGWSENKVKTTLHRALKTLKKRYDINLKGDYIYES